MSDQPTDLMDYASLMQNALRGVIRQALARAASLQGLPGGHHFFVTFLTHAPGVSIPDDLKARYPQDITIVLQHQFRDLRVTDTFFRVTLTFGGFPKILTVPYSAVTRFHDPFAQFMLEFEPGEGETVIEMTEEEDADIEEIATDVGDIVPEPAPPVEKPAAESDAPKIVSLDQFRKK